MASRHGSETEESATSASRGVWGFMKRKVWGDVPSHPISDSGSDSRAASPEPAVNSPVDMSTPKATTPHEESRPQSPFQGHAQPDHDSQSDEDAPESQQTGLSSSSNKATNMASEPSLRHGLGEGEARLEAASDDNMNRVASLASGISGSGFEWNPNPAGQQSRLARNPASAPESNLTFSPSAANDGQMGQSPSNLPVIFSGDWTDSVDDVHPSESSIQQILDEVMFDEEDYSKSASSNARQEQLEESPPSFDSIQTKAPGLTPLRLTPKSAPEKTRVANPPPPTRFPARDVSAQGGTTPQEVEQSNEQQLARRGADFTPSPRTGAIVDELLQGVVSENLATGDTPKRARQQGSQLHGAQQVGRIPTELKAVPHGATQVGPAPIELESVSHGAEQVEGESDEKSRALRIPQIGGDPLPHGALQVDAMPRLAHMSTGTDAAPEDSMDSPRSTTSAMSGVSMTSQGTPRSPFRRAVGYAEAAVGLTGGAVAGIMAGTALVGIGAVALTGGAVLNAVDFPRSPRQAQKTGTVGRSASDAGMLAQTGAEAQQGALPDLPEASRPALEHVSSSAKRQADSSWADSKSPHKRQEVDQSPEHTAAGPVPQAMAADRDADDSVTTDAGAELANSRLTVQHQGADSGSADAPAQDDDAASNSSGGFMSYIPGTHANRVSHAGQAPDPYLGDGPAARLASYIPGGTTAGRLASYLPGSSTAGRLADYAVSRAEQGFAHYSEHPTAQPSSTGTETRAELASYSPGTQANQGESRPELAASQSEQGHNTLGSQVNQQGTDKGTATSHSSKQGIGSSSGGSSSSGGGGGVISYIPDTEANQASTAAQELGLDSDKSSGLASSLASYIPGTQANRASRAEEGPAATSGSSSDTASYVPGAGADRAADEKQSRVEAESSTHAEQGRLDESGRGSSVGSGVAGYIPGTQANRAAHADSGSDSGSGSGLASYIPGTQANRATQAQPGTGLASYIPGTEANRAANTAPDQSPHSDRGSVSGTSIGSREAASEPTGATTASTPEGHQNTEYPHERHSSSVSDDAAGNVAGVQDDRQAEGKQAPQAATASDTTRAGQSPDASETKSPGPEQATQRGDASIDAKPESQQQTQSQRQTQQQAQSHDHGDRGSPEHVAEEEMAEAAPETASILAPEATSAAAPQEPGLQSRLAQHAAAASAEDKDMVDIKLPYDDSQAEWDAHHTHQPVLDQGPLPTVSEEPLAEKAAVQASNDTQSPRTQQASSSQTQTQQTQPSQTQSQETQPSQAQPQGNWPHQRSWPHQIQTQLAEPQGAEREEEARGEEQPRSAPAWQESDQPHQSLTGRLLGMIAGRQGVDEAPSDSHTAGHADSPDAFTSVDAPPEPPLQSEIGQQQAAAVEGQSDRHVNTRQGPSDAKGVPEETALKSDVGQQRAAAGEGQAARHGLSSGRPQTDDAQTFASQHSVQNEAPIEQESMFAKPLTADRQTHHDRHGEEASNDQPQTHHAQTFALQHQVNNEAPGSQDSMFAEPLASDSQQHQQEAVPAGQQATADRLHTRDVQTGVPQGQAGSAPQVSQLDEPQSQGSSRDKPQASESQVDLSEELEQGKEQEHQSLAGRLFGLIARGQGQSESEATRHADSAAQSAAPLQPALHSEVGQQQSAAIEGQTAGQAASSQAVTAAGGPEGAAAGSDMGQQQTNAVDGRAARHGAALEGSTAADAPGEPALESGIARQAAAVEQGSVFDDRQDCDFQQQHSSEPDHPSSSETPQTANAQTFPHHHQVHNEAPGGPESMFAQPLTSDENQPAAATQQRQPSLEQSHDDSPQAFASQHQVNNAAPAELEHTQPLTSGRQASGNQDFVSQHQMHNASPASQQAMYSVPLTSDRHPSGARQPEHQASAGGGNESLLPSVRQPLSSAGQTSGDHDFPLQHSMTNEAPAAETSNYAQPLASDQQHAGQQQHERQPEQQQHGESEPIQVPEAHGRRQAAPVQQGDGEVPEASSQQAEEPHQSLTGRLFSSLFGSHGHHPQAESPRSHGEQPVSTPAAEPASHHTQAAGTGTQSVAPDMAQSRQPGPEGVGDDESMAASDADLHTARRAQREVLQAEQESLSDSRQSLMQVRESLQRQQPDNESRAAQQYSNDSAAESDAALHTAQQAQRKALQAEQESQAASSRQGLAEVREPVQQHQATEEGVSEAGRADDDLHSQAGTEDESTAETDAALSSAQQAQREAMLVSQSSLNDSRKRLMEVREAMQQQRQEHHYGRDQQYGQEAGQEVYQQADNGQYFDQDQQSGHNQQQNQGQRSAERQQYSGDEQAGYSQAHVQDQTHPPDQLSDAGQQQSYGQQHGQQQQDLDRGMAESDADMHTARQAQREALQAEQESLQSSRQGLQEVREAMQQRSQTGPTGSHARTEAADTYSQTGSEDKSTAETDAALSSAQQAQREAMLVSQNSLNDSRKRLLEVREAMQQQGQEHHHGQDQQYGQQQQYTGDQRLGQDQQRSQDDHFAGRHSFDQGQQHAGAQQVGQQFDQDQQYAQDQAVGQQFGRDQQYAQDQHVGQRFGRDQQYAQDQQVGQQFGQNQQVGQKFGQDQHYTQDQQVGQEQYPGPGRGYHQVQELLPDQEPRREQHHDQQQQPSDDQYGQDQSGPQDGQDQQYGQGQRQQYDQAQAGASAHMQQEQPHSQGAYREGATPAHPQEDSWLPVSRAQPSPSGPSRGGFSGSYHISHHIDDASETSNWTYTPRQQQAALYDQNWPQQQQQQQQQVMPQYEQSFPHYEQALPQLQPQQPQVMPDYEQRPSQPQHGPSQYAPAPLPYDQQPSQYEQSTSQYPQAQAQPEHVSSQHERASSQHEQPPAHYEQAPSQFEQALAQREQLPLQCEQAQEPIPQFSSQHQQALSLHETPPYPEQASPQHEQSAPQQQQRQRSVEQREAQQAPMYPDAPQQHSVSDHMRDARSEGSGQHLEEVDTSVSNSSTHATAESASSEPPGAEQSLEHGSDTEGAAHNTAEQHPAAQADSSSSGMRYDWAPPNSLWGRATAAAGSLAAAFTGTSEAGTTDVSTAAGSAAGRTGTPEAASALPQETETAGKARDETAGGVYADTADRNIADTSGGGEPQRAESDYASPDTTQEGYGWSRPATHANFARGNMTSRPARLRPALPQHWVQAVDERAADSGTPTSARSIPEASIATGTQSSQPSSGRDLSRGSTDITSGHHRSEASVPEERSLPSAQPEHATAVAEAPQPTHETEAVEQPAAVETGPPPRDTNVNEGSTNTAGQAGSRDAVKLQQEAAQNSQGWQHAGLGGSVAPATPQAASTEPVPEAMLQSQLAGQDALPKDQSAGRAHAVADHAVHAEPAEDLSRVLSQPRSSSATAPAVDAGSAAARPQSRAPALVEAAENPYSSYPLEAATPIFALRAADFHKTDPSAANRGATQPLGQGYTTAQPEASVAQVIPPPAADGVPGASSSTSAAAAARSQPQSAAMLSLEAMIPPPFELSSSPDSERLSAYATPVATSTPAQSAFQSAAYSDSTFGSHPQPGVQYMPAEAVAQGLDNKGAVSGSRPPLQASAPAPAGDNSSGSGYSSNQSRQMLRLNSPEVQRQIEQTAAEVQEAVNERGGRQSLSGGGTQEGEALARATGALRALVAGHVEEAESLSRGLPSHSGTTEHYPSERQVAAMRSVDGTTQAAKTASLERGVEAAFVFATADRAAAMLKALAVGKPLDKMESVPEASMEDFPSAESLHELGVTIGPDQVSHTHDQESPFEVDASEGSFASAVSRAAPANSEVSETEYASIADEPADQLPEACNNLGGNGVMTRAPSVPTKSPYHHTATAPMVAADPSLRSTPVDWGSPAPATVPSQAPGSPPATGPGQPPLPPVSQTGGSRDTAAALGTHESVSQHAAPLPLGGPIALRSTPVDWGSPARTQPPMGLSNPMASSAGMKGGEVSLGPEVQAASTETRGVHASKSSSEEADIENVNPQAVRVKHGGLPSTTQQPQAQAQAVGLPIALAEAPLLAEVKPTSSSTPVAVPTPTPGGNAVSKQPGVAAAAATAQSVLPVASAAGSTANKPFVAGQALSNTPVLSDTSQARVSSAVLELRTPAAASDATAATSADAGFSSGADTTVPQASAASANKPFISSKALSDALFGSSDDPASPIRSPRTAQRPTSPFAEASTTAVPAATAAASTGGTAGTSKGAVEGVSTEQPRFSGLSSKGTSRAERIEEALMSSTSPFSRRLSSEEVEPVMARGSQDKPRGTSPVKEEEAQGSAGAAAHPGVQSPGVEGVRQGASGAGESAKHAGPGGDEIQAAQAASGSATAARPAGSSTTSAAHVASTTTGAASAAGQTPARCIAEADDGKARFVCCSFGGRKAGKKQRK